jgi:hypothetical protein
MKLRKFQLSCPVFWGYNKYIDVEKYNNINDILKHVLNSCGEFFQSNNLIDLFEFFKSIKHLYHIHDANFESVINSKDTDIFYICRHDGCETAMDLTIINK